MVDVFISYCREDEAYLKRLLQTLAGYGMAVCDTCWSDRSLQAGQLWRAELNAALARARLGILMVTPGFLASDFIRQNELPQLLARAEAESLKLVPIPVRPVDWQAQAFNRYQSLLDPKQPLARLIGVDQDDAYVQIGQFIKAQLDLPRLPRLSGAGSPQQALDPQAEELARLQRQRSRLEAEGKAVGELTQKIMTLRRGMREGRQLRQGDVLCDRYVLEVPLGSGGFASVWRAMDTGQNRLVALKLLHSQYSEDRTRRERFFRGARKMAELKHEGIVTVHERECRDGQVYFYVMAYMPGGDLEAAVLRGDVPREHWLPVLLQVGAALQFAHEHQLVHRDIKPSNILLSRDGRQARLSDFDLVRDAQSTAGTKDGLGTFVYAAPECLNDGANGDARADVFGLGMTFVFAMAGKKLEIEALVDAPGTIGALGLQAPLAKALTRAVALKRDQRTESVAALCQEIQAALAPPPEQPRLATPLETTVLKPQPVVEAKQEKVIGKAVTSASPLEKERHLEPRPQKRRLVPRQTLSNKATNAIRRWPWLGILLVTLIIGFLYWRLRGPFDLGPKSPESKATSADPEAGNITAKDVEKVGTPDAKSPETKNEKGVVNAPDSSNLAMKHVKDDNAKDFRGPSDLSPKPPVSTATGADLEAGNITAKDVEKVGTPDAKSTETKGEKGVVNAHDSSNLATKHVKDDNAKDNKSIDAKGEKTIAHTKILAPEQSKYPWAVRSGVDAIGTWAEIKVNGVRAVLRWIPAGSFWMGSPKDEADRSNHETRHNVTLTLGFWLGETEVTQALWQEVMGENPSTFKGPGLPVETVSWDDTTDFLKRLNVLVPGLELRLPTEAEWEYACRAGTQTPFSFGETINSLQANFDGNYPYGNSPKSKYREKTVAVKSLPANAWGLHEMHGNVWEWCADFMGPYSKQEVVDPRGSDAGADRVLRGGSWFNNGRNVRAAVRGSGEPGGRSQGVGVRLARGQ